ncbi:MAG: PEGA domain-containing protein [Deinococcales bacterium]
MNFLSEGDPGEVFEVNITPVETSSELDYSILAVAGSPGRKYGNINLSQVRDPKPLENLFIVHHPNGAPKALTRERCYMHPSWDLISATEVWHRCDTQGGSSGSLVFTEDGYVVGIHWGGYDNTLPPESRYNVAKKFTAIIARSPFLQRLVPNAIPLINASNMGTGVFSLTSFPSGASVFLNGSFVGTTPLQNVPLLEGNYDTRISQNGYQDVYATVVIRQNSITQGNLNLQPSLLMATRQSPLAQPKPQALLIPSSMTRQSFVDTTAQSRPGVVTNTMALNNAASNASQASLAPSPSLQPSFQPPLAATTPTTPFSALPLNPMNTPNTPWQVIGQGIQSAADRMQFVIITDANSLYNIWVLAYGNVVNIPSLPAVDFSRESIVAVFLGIRPSGGYSLNVDKVNVTAEASQVYLNIINPDRNSFTTQALTSPWIMVKVPMPNVRAAYFYDVSSSSLLDIAQR